MKTVFVAVTPTADRELVEYAERFGHLAAETITTFLRDIKADGDRLGALAVLMNMALATGDAILSIKRDESGELIPRGADH